MLKLDAAGGIEWQKTYGGTGPDLFVSIRPTADGGYIAAGSYTYISDLWLVKLDAAGGIQWQETIGQWRADRAVLALPTADGGYFVEGRIYYGSGYNVWLMKLDANGSILWQEMLSLMGDGSGSGGRVTPDGGYILAVGARLDDRRRQGRLLRDQAGRRRDDRMAETLRSAVRVERVLHRWVHVREHLDVQLLRPGCSRRLIIRSLAIL